ncbi:InlB B-repeat-containing protein, partial [Bifidobacterium panos]
MVRFSSHDGLGRWLAAIPAAILAMLMVLAVAVPSAWAEGDGDEATKPEITLKADQKTFLGLGSKTEGASYKLEQAEVGGKASSYVVVQVDSGYFVPNLKMPTGATAVDGLNEKNEYTAPAANGKYTYVTFRSADNTASIQPADLQTYLRGLTFYTDASENKTQNITVSAASEPLKIEDSTGNDTNYSVTLFNGHAYTYVNTKKNWDASYAAAKTISFLGQKGHLLTIESAQEHNLIYKSFNNQSGWIGATRWTSAKHAGDNPADTFSLDNDGESDWGTAWYWVTGPNAGQMIWTNSTAKNGHAVDGVYTNWNVGGIYAEPTGYGDTEEGVAFYGFGSAGQWNDGPNVSSSVPGFYVEFEGFKLDETETGMIASAAVDPVDVTYSLDARVTTTDTLKRAVVGESYSATLTASEGSLDSSLVSVKVQNGDATTTLVSGTDYTFDADGDSGLLKIPGDKVTGAIEITATVGRTVEFVLGVEGYGEMKNGTPESLVVTNGLAVSKGADYALPEVNVTDAGTKAGKKFAGWRLSATDEGTSTGSDDGLFSPTAAGAWVVRSDATFKAEYVDADRVTVQFDYAGGTADNASSKTLSGFEGVEYDVPAPTRAGYEFAGWTTTAKDVTVPSKTDTKAAYEADVTFKAEWTAKDNTVTFAKGDNGSFAGDAKTSFTVKSGQKVETGKDDEDGEYAEPTVTPKAGWSFTGWLCDENQRVYSTGEVKDYLVSGAASPVTFTAQYAKNDGSTVVFNANGGTVSGESSKVVSGLIDQTYDVPEKTDMKLDGYEFKGWQDADKKDVTPTGTYATAGVTVYTAKWQAQDQTVTFTVKNETEGEAGDGTLDTGVNQSLTVKTDQALNTSTETYKAPTVTPVAGKEFVGWKSSLDNAVYQPGQIASLVAKPGLGFTAVYRDLPEVTVTFDYNGGTLNGETSSTLTGVKDTAYTDGDAVPTNVTRDGYEFKGWTLDGKDATPTGKYESATYKAKWQAADVTVTFNANGGTLDTGVNETLTVKTGSKLDTTTKETYVEPTLTAPAGKKFTGWLSSADNVLYQPSQIAGLPAAYGLTFTAQYVDLPDATVTYDYNGGNVDGATSLTLSGTANGEYTAGDAAKAAKEPTRAGYEFAGWDTPPSGKYVNVKYTAQWTANENTVTFKDGDHGTIAAGEQTQWKVNTGSAVNGKPAAPTADGGYRFTGWLCDEDDRVYSQDSVDKYIVAGTNEGAKAGTVSFTAQYVPESSVQVLYNYAGGLDADNNSSLVLTGRDGQEYTTADKAKVPTSLSRTGYTFKGWDKELSETYKSVTYTAVWERTVNTVVFDKGDGTGLTGESTYQVSS